MTASARAPGDAVLSAAQRAAIIEHMNADHADALLLYARVQGGRPGAERARMLDIDALGMTLCVIDGGEEVRLGIPFSRPLAHAGDARRQLVEMAAAARRASGGALER